MSSTAKFKNYDYGAHPVLLYLYYHVIISRLLLPLVHHLFHFPGYSSGTLRDLIAGLPRIGVNVRAAMCLVAAEKVVGERIDILPRTFAHILQDNIVRGCTSTYVSGVLIRLTPALLNASRVWSAALSPDGPLDDIVFVVVCF